MALATRELELVIIARDRASTVLARIGGAMAVLGAGAARVGAAGIGEFAEMTMEAIEFRRQVALAFTQAEIAGLEYNDVLHMIRNTARQTSVPIEELSEATFDIFSSVTLGSIEEAQLLLDKFAMSAMAGQAPIKDVGRAALAWVNALDMEPTAENLNRILDNQFELVRKGVGTYEEFETVIGRAIPAFVSADQSIEHLGGVMAFLTRNGLHASNATASAARAVELLFSPKAIKSIKNLGIEVVDSTGGFRGMEEILGELLPHFTELDAAGKKNLFKDIFGTGSIQARRFFDLVLQEDNFEEFLFLLGEMEGAAGGVAEAFDIMSAEPAVQLEILKNRFAVLRQEIGDRFIPFLVNKLLPAIDRILDAWDELDEIQKDNLVKWATFATIFVTVAGGLAAILGTFLLFLGLLKAFAGSIGVAVLLGGGIALAIGAIAAAIALAVVDFELFTEIFGPWWLKALELLQPVADWLETNWPEAWQVAEDAYANVKRFLEEEWPQIWENMKTAVTEWLDSDWYNFWDGLTTSVGNFASELETIINEDIIPAWDGFTAFFDEHVVTILDNVTRITDSLDTDLAPGMQRVLDSWAPVLGEISETLRAFGEALIIAFGTITGVIAFIWDNWGNELATHVGIVFGTIGELVELGLNVIQGFLGIFVAIFTGDWEKFWNSLETIMQAPLDLQMILFDAFGDYIGNVFQAIFGNREGWDTFWNQLKEAPGEFVEWIVRQVDAINAAIGRLNPFDDVPLIGGTDPQTGGGTGGDAGSGGNTRPGNGRNRSGGSTPSNLQGANTDNSKTVNFEEGSISLMTLADPDEIARAIAWEALNS